MRKMVKNSKDFKSMVLDYMKEYDLIDISFISPTSRKWFGKYGLLVEFWTDGSIQWYESPRKVWRIINDYGPRNKSDIQRHWKFKYYRHEDEETGEVYYQNRLFIFDAPINYIYKGGDNLIILSNGQLYDIVDRYWFDRSTSKQLKKAIKNGYIYEDLESWFSHDATYEYELEQAKIEELFSNAIAEYNSFDKDNKIAQIKEWILNSLKADPYGIEDENEIYELSDNYDKGEVGYATIFSIRTDLCLLVESDTKPAWVLKLVKMKVEFDYYNRIKEDPKKCLEVLRECFPKLDKAINEKLANGDSLGTYEKFWDAVYTHYSNASYTDAMSNLSHLLDAGYWMNNLV